MRTQVRILNSIPNQSWRVNQGKRCDNNKQAEDAFLFNVNSVNNILLQCLAFILFSLIYKILLQNKSKKRANMRLEYSSIV